MRQLNDLKFDSISLVAEPPHPDWVIVSVTPNSERGSTSMSHPNAVVAPGHDIQLGAPNDGLMLTTYARKPFFVKGVQVTPQNMIAVAEWCNGEIKTEGKGQYIHVPVERAANDRQEKAFVGDWVLHAPTGFKCYTPRAFQNNFEKTAETTVVSKTAPVTQAKIATAQEAARPKPGPMRAATTPVPPGETTVTPEAAEAVETVVGEEVVVVTPETVAVEGEPVVTFGDGSQA